jgi:hypothetical protein
MKDFFKDGRAVLVLAYAVLFALFVFSLIEGGSL